MRALPLLISTALLAGCTVGPDYAGPPPAPGSASGFVRGGDATSPQAPVLARWWTALNDPLLDTLEERALASNPGIAVAQARLRQARASLRLERANQTPSLSASGRYVHAQIPEIDLGGLTGGGQGSGGSGEGGGQGGGQASGGGVDALNFYNVGFDASWEIDLFGGQRRKVESARASAEAAQANVADAQVQLTAEVASAYVNLRDRQQRLDLGRNAAAMQQRMLDLTQQRRERGAASDLDVERLRNQVESTQAQLVPIGAEIEAYMNALAVLTGAEPGALDATLKTPGAVPLPPQSVAVGDPAAMLQRRPDVRAAERQLAAQTAQIGTAEAARFPRLSFMGILGLGGTKPEALTDFGNLAAIAMPTLSWSFLDFGRNNARVRQAEGARDEAEAQYRQAVLGALRDAEDALSRFGHRRATLASLARVETSASKAATLMQQRYRAGAATLIDTLDAERQRIAAEQNFTAGTASLTADYIAVQKALGLGWSEAAE